MPSLYIRRVCVSLIMTSTLLFTLEMSNGQVFLACVGTSWALLHLVFLNPALLFWPDFTCLSSVTKISMWSKFLGQKLLSHVLLSFYTSLCWGILVLESTGSVLIFSFFFLMSRCWSAPGVKNVVNFFSVLIQMKYTLVLMVSLTSKTLMPTVYSFAALRKISILPSDKRGFGTSPEPSAHQHGI